MSKKGDIPSVTTVIPARSTMLMLNQASQRQSFSIRKASTSTAGEVFRWIANASINAERKVRLG